MLIFSNPAAFLLLLAIPLLFALRWFGVFNSIALPLTLSDWNGKSFRWNSRLSMFALYVSRFLVTAAFVLVVTALANPLISRQERVYTSRGAEIIFVIDTSPSMAAADIANMTRLDAAKQAIQFLTHEQNGMAYGMVPMASEAALAVPPTMDYALFLSQLDALRIGELGDGTALGTGLSVAVYHLSASIAPKKCVVLLTDGENNAGAIHPNTAARLAKTNAVTVYTVGIGTRGAVAITYSDPVTGKTYSGFLDSQFDEEPLREIADEGGGNYFAVTSLPDLEHALASIAGREYVAQSWHNKLIEEYFYDRLVLAALAAAAVAWIIRRLYLREGL
jgi:Ca-activated chloride channel family protein